VNPLLAPSPGCEISKPCFSISLIYLARKIQLSKLKITFDEKYEQDRIDKKKKILVSVEVVQSKIFIPYKNVFVRCHNIRMQKPFSIPPA